MKNIKNLTEQQCVDLASFLYPKFKWEYIISKYKWDGHDVVSKDKNEEGFNKAVFQISFDGKFTFYDENLYDYPADLNKVEEWFLKNSI